MSIRVKPLTGDALIAALPDLARLRTRVFADFPYLYQGDAESEVHYLRSYHNTPRAVLVAAIKDNQIIGAATGMPLTDHGDASQLTGPMPPATDIFYCAESVLLPEYRGQGLGHQFFDLREAHARSLNLTHSAFCAVIRPSDHSAKRANYRPHDAFWRAHGYTAAEDVTAQFTWTDIGDTHETPKTLQFWMKTL